MARRRKSSLTGRVFREATRALPAPAQFVLATPLRAFLALVIFAALASYGVVSVQWQNGRPTLHVDQQKAAELKEKGVDWIEEHEDEITDRLWGDDADATPETKGSPLTTARNKARAIIRRD